VFDLDLFAVRSKKERYDRIKEFVVALLQGEQDFIANSANLSALLWHTLPDINWVGVYRLGHSGLILGPFQGKPACVRIAIGKGVCGTAVARRETIVVPDVRQFEGHIACDSVSRSEIVIPLRCAEKILVGVLDIDSPVINRFDEIDRKYLEEIAEILTFPIRKAFKEE